MKPADLRLLTRVKKGDDDEELTQKPLDWRLIWRLIGLTQGFRWKRNGLLVICAIRAIQLPALSWVLAWVIQKPIAEANVAGVIAGAVGFAVLALTTQLVMHFRQRWALELGEEVVFQLRNRLFDHLQKMPMSWYQRNRLGRIISRMTSDVEEIRIGVQDILFICLVQLGQMLFAAVWMLWYDWQLFLIVLAIAPILWWINHLFHRRMSVALREMRESFSRVTATLAESVNGIRVTQGFSREVENARMFEALAVDHSRYNSKVLRTQGLFLPMLEFNAPLFTSLLLVMGAYRMTADSNPIAVGDLVGFFLMSNLFFSPISVLGNQYNQALQAMSGAERLFGLLDAPIDQQDAEDASDLPVIKGRVEFENVVFGYDPNRPVLHGISFDARPGQTIALVGHTGSGKTTISHLLAKFYLPQLGQIRIDGIPLAKIRSNSLRKQMAIVLQQNFLFHGTVADNIRFGNPSATDEEIIAILDALDGRDLIEQLPFGLATEVGERGAALSLGQRQWVCFARALLADPKILILDEATSSLDVPTEMRLQRALEVLMRGRTTFVIAHRLSTVRDADQILVLDHGKIIQRGTHSELIQTPGHYSELYRQFLGTEASEAATGHSL